MVWTMGDVCSVSSGDSRESVDGVACSFFEFGLSADASQILGTTKLSLSSLVSH